jgi:hypothetical protein
MSAITSTELTLSHGKPMDASQIGLSLAQVTQLSVMVQYDHHEDWTPFTTTYLIDSFDNLLLRVLKLSTGTSSTQVEEPEDGTSEYTFLINNTSDNATQTQCTIYNSNVSALKTFLENNPSIEVI